MDGLKEQFDRDGFVVVRDLLRPFEIERCLEQWACIKDTRTIDKYNPVSVETGTLGHAFILARGSALGCIAKLLLGELAYIYNVRFVAKDDRTPGPVFVHQDSGYHVGSMIKLSAFVALSSVIPENGGLKFWPGTHVYGYLGDCGEIDPDVIETDRPPVCPVLGVGDVVFMNSHLWHESGPKITGPDRILLDIIYQRADDPAKALPRDRIFKRSRVSRLKELQSIVDSRK